MNTHMIFKKSGAQVFYGYKIKPADIRQCLLKLTDLSGALYSFSLRVIKNERPRKKLIIDIEMAKGFDPGKYEPDMYLHELIARLKKISRNFREYIRHVPAEFFPELYFHPYSNVQFSYQVYSSKTKYFL